MHLLIIFVNTVLNLLSKLWIFLFNHLLNVPLSLLLGVGKYVAFLVAVVIDQFQMFFAYKILEDTRLGRKFSWIVGKKIRENKEKWDKIALTKHINKYLIISMLAFLPVYSGGMFFAVFYAHSLKINKLKSYIALSLGSIIGCAMWTIGVVNFVFLVVEIIKRIF